MSYRIGIDIGGTFTDFTIVNNDGNVFLWKEDSNKQEPVRAIEAGLRASADELGLSVEKLLADTEQLVHGTTIATNMLIQRNGPPIGLLCTAGFRDVLYFRNGYKPERFNVHLAHPGEFVPRYLRLEVGERIDARGSEIAALAEEDVRAAAGLFREAGVEAVAVAFLWSMMDPSHEIRATELLAEELPGVHLVRSSEVLPEIREWERTSATVLSAYIVPGIAEYLSELETWLGDHGLRRPPLIMQINGGCARVGEIIRRPVNILASGPAAAPAAALHYAGSAGDDLITVDMGGTSLDVCLIKGRQPTMSRDIQVEHQPIGVPAVDASSIGAGGGSIAFIDAGGALQVGPRSAGARPGPACYGFGGDEPTVTDANVVLGYLAPEAFLGGRRTLRADLSQQVVKTRVADRLGLSPTEAAAGIVRVVNANMVAAIREASVQRGLDPRNFTLVCGGGAGGLHAASLARELGIESLFVPAEAGTFCAMGMTVTDVRHDHTAALHMLTNSADLIRLNAAYDRLRIAGRSALAEEGFDENACAFHRSVDARYPGQVHEITMDLPGSGSLTEADMRDLEERFHEAHFAQYAYNRSELPVETLHWRLAAIGMLPRVAHATGEASRFEPEPSGSQMAYFADLGERTETPTYRIGDLAPGAEISGPAIVQAPTTTIVINPGDTLRLRADGNLFIRVAASRIPAAV